MATPTGHAHPARNGSMTLRPIVVRRLYSGWSTTVASPLTAIASNTMKTMLPLPAQQHEKCSNMRGRRTPTHAAKRTQFQQ